MKKNLIVILGAGASYDSVGPDTPRDNNFIPPLVTGLFFNRSSFVQIQEHYPLVSSAASEIRAFTDSSASVEQFLRERYRDSESIDDKRSFFEIPLYLQHLLFDVSKYYTSTPDNYDILIRQVNRLEDVMYVTLNYDLILDNRLSALFKLSSLESYTCVNPSKNWSLIKLHGSVNWGYEVKNKVEGANERDYFRGAFANLYGNLQIDSDDIVVRDGDLKTIRFQPTPGKLFYPALSVPIGAYDELVCPKYHIKFLKDKLSGMDGLNLLVIGYSGNDVEVMKILEESGKNVKSLKVVNGSDKIGRIVVQKLSDILKFVPNNEMVYNNTFNNFVRDGSLSKFISE